MAANASAMGCELKPTDDLTWSVLIVQNCAVAAILAVMLRAVHRSVDIAHPIFALIFQQNIVLLFCSCLNILGLVGMALFEDSAEEMFGVYLVGNAFALLFHQVTWLVVTLLRYLLTYKVKPEVIVDFVKLRRQAMIAVWVIELVFVPLSQTPWFALLVSYGWPKVSMLEMWEKDELFMWKLVLPSYLLSNLPDYISFLIYFHMRYLTKKAAKIYPEQQDLDIANIELENDLDNFGGIWVGVERGQTQDQAGIRVLEPSLHSSHSERDHEIGPGDLDKIEAKKRNRHLVKPEVITMPEENPTIVKESEENVDSSLPTEHQEHTLKHKRRSIPGKTMSESDLHPYAEAEQQEHETPSLENRDSDINIEVFPMDIIDADGMEPPLPPPPTQESIAERQAQTISRMITLYILFGFADLFMVLTDFVICSLGGWGKVFSFTCQMLVCYWIPILVISTSFQQIGELWRKAAWICSWNS